MNADESRRILTLSDDDLNEVIKIIPNDQVISFFSNLSRSEQKTFFKKANPLSAVKILCSLADELAGEIILFYIEPKEAVAIGRQLWPYKKERLVNHMRDEHKRKLHTILYSGLKVHHLTE